MLRLRRKGHEFAPPLATAEAMVLNGALGIFCMKAVFSVCTCKSHKLLGDYLGESTLHSEHNLEIVLCYRHAKRRD